VKKKIIVVGGGAAGFFAAANAASHSPDLDILILEQSPKVLSKVKISGGGRCNLTHACFEPRQLVAAYPRGQKALLGPFSKFMTGDVMAWFEDRGVALKIEDDGRVFPVSDLSQSVIDCLMQSARDHGVEIRTREQVQDFYPENGKWKVISKEGNYEADALLIASGSSKAIWEKLSALGHEIIAPVPSLFTFNIKDNRIKSLQGISVEDGRISVLQSKLEARGALLITHWGMSGPAVLKLSSWGARDFFARNYEFSIEVNWLGDKKAWEVKETIQQLKRESPKKFVHKHPLFGLPSRLWRSFLDHLDISEEKRWADVSKVHIERLSIELTGGIYQVEGKSTFKDEFVTAGGVSLDEVDFRTMESKLFPGLYFAGEVLDIDAVTGGYNFQAAWTTGWMVAQEWIAHS